MPSPKKPTNGKSTAKKSTSAPESKDVVKKAKPVSAAKKVVAVVRGAATKLVSKSADPLLAEPMKPVATAAEAPKSEPSDVEPPVAAPAPVNQTCAADVPVAVMVPVASVVAEEPAAEPVQVKIEQPEPTPAVESKPEPTPITHEMIAARAKQLWIERGCRDGFAREDWRDAEAQLKAEAQK